MAKCSAACSRSYSYAAATDASRKCGPGSDGSRLRASLASARTSGIVSRADRRPDIPKRKQFRPRLACGLRVLRIQRHRLLEAVIGPRERPGECLSM